MSLSLSASDLAQLERALRIALAPGDQGSAPAWGAALCEAASALVGGGALGSVIVMNAGAVHQVLHTEVPTAIHREYQERFAAYDQVSIRALERRIPVAHELDVSTPEELARDPFYNDFSLRHGLPCNFGVSAFRGGEAPHRLMLTFPEWPDEAVRERAGAVLRALAPAFIAGVETVARLTAAPAALARVLDLLAEPTVVCDRRGAVVHENPAFRALVTEARAAGGAAAEALVRAELRALAGGLGALLGARGTGRGAVGRGDAPPAALREFRVAGARLRARGCLTAEATFAAEALVWVTVERAGGGRAEAGAPARAAPGGAPAGDEGALRDRFGLTAQELAVARLMAERRTNEEIGAALGISPHTARTHAERVRRKLGVARRTDVSAALAGTA
jgi:DNA-binding CsgD family transcriptional regulator